MRIATLREVTDRQKDRHTDTGNFIICPMLCYSNGTDKNTKIADIEINKQTFKGHLIKFTEIFLSRLLPKVIIIMFVIICQSLPLQKID